MLKTTYALGVLAAATLGCFFTPLAQATQVEVNKQNAQQNAAAVGTGNAVIQDLEQSSSQNQLKLPGSSGYYHPQPTTPQIQISDQDALQNGAGVGHGNVVIQDLGQSSSQNQLKLPGSSGYYYPQPTTPQIQISNQDGRQNGQVLVLAMPLSKNSSKTTLRNNSACNYSYIDFAR